jgi:nitrile hydratase accessory protein
MRRAIADMPGAAELPRRNGELVFDEPWESRAFGLAVTASEAGVYDWEEFRQGLIAEIGAWESEHGRDHLEGGEWRYYPRWLASLERVLAEKGVVARDELERRMDELEHEDDHGHHHHHDLEGAH